MKFDLSERSKRARAIALSVILACSPMLSTAGLESDMENMFNSMGGMASVNGPGAYKGQTMGVLTGGSVQWRVPQKSYQLFTMTAPSLKAGCGGIDLRMGSFSYINEDKFKEMLEAIGDATVGLLFQAALSSLSPQLKGILDNLEAVARFVNQANVNACKAAESLILGATGALTQSETEKCVMGRLMKGVDMNQARAACKDNAASINQTNATDPSTKKIAPRDVNIMWDALENTMMSKEDKELLINLVGTSYRQVAKDDATGPQPFVDVIPKLTSATQLLYGNEAGSGGKIIIKPWWKCVAHPSDPMKPCSSMESVDAGIEVKSFETRVQSALDKWKTYFNANSKPNLEGGDADLLRLANNSQIPVYRMMALGYWSPDPSTMDTLITRYKRSISYEFAYAYLGASMKDALGYLSNFKPDVTEDETRLAAMKTRIINYMQLLEAERSGYLASEPSINAMVSNLERVDRQFRTTGSPRIREFMGRALQMSKGKAG